MPSPDTKSLLIAVFAFGASTVGCQDAPQGKVAISGDVTWNGAPIATGYISFVPADGQKPSESSKIEDGSFSLYGYPGTNKIRILATKEAGFDAGMNQPILVQYIPEKYNDKTELLHDVQSDGETGLSFALTGDDAK
ncbi:MAG: DUF1416 domain-containing protein [Planctomycetales bacterium]|nr:DUF1416 domain-containing protein [Planctomycetales bacterium]